MASWSKEELEKLQELYPICNRNDILFQIPKRNWSAILIMAGRLKIKRLNRKHNNKLTDIERFFNKVNKNSNIFGKFKNMKTECWFWQGCINNSGYGSFCFNNNWGLAHRFSYLSFVGNIPNHLECHHVCEIEKCVNPEHLILLTPKENSSLNKKDFCIHGHSMSENNIYIRPDGKGRDCKACRRTRCREHYHKKIDKIT